MPPDEEKCPLEVKKQIYPRSKDGYLLDDTIQILVEAKCLGIKPDYIQIFEYVDNNFEIINISDNTSKCYIVNTLPELVKFYEALNEKNLTYFGNVDDIEKVDIKTAGKGTLYVQISNKEDLSTKGRLIYWYYVKPKNSGSFNLGTTMRLPEKCPDIDIRLDIDIKDHDPKFDTDLDVDNLEIDIDDKIDLTYNLLYLGGSNNPYNFEIKVDPSSEYDIIGEKCMTTCSNSTPPEYIQFNTSIKYLSTGRHYLPSISIADFGTNKIMRRYTFKSKDIVVNDWTQRHIDELSILATILAAMMATLIYEIRKIRRKISKNNLEQISQDEAH